MTLNETLQNVLNRQRAQASENIKRACGELNKAMNQLDEIPDEDGRFHSLVDIVKQLEGHRKELSSE